MDNYEDVKKILDTIDSNHILKYTKDTLKNHLSMSSEILIKYNTFLDELERHHGNYKTLKKTRDVGDILENLVSCIFEGEVFDIAVNCRTCSNEIDLLVKTNIEYLVKNDLTLDKIICGKDFICECKNYKKVLSVTWVNKVHSLMEERNRKLGIIFSYHGISGEEKTWNFSRGFIKKILLKSLGKDDLNKEVYILSFDINDLTEISQENNFLEILERKKNELKNDIVIKKEEHNKQYFSNKIIKHDKNLT